MNSVIETIFARRPPIDYISPAACEVTLSGSGLLSLILPVLNPFGRIRAVRNVLVLGEGSGPFSLDWETTPGEDPPVICYNIYQVVGEELILVAECVTPPGGGGGVPLPPGSPGGGDTYVVTPVTTEGEGPPSLPVTTPIIPPVDVCDTDEGEDTTCTYGAVGTQYRIKNYNSALWDISACGLSWTTCPVCEIAPDIGCVDPVEWTGTWPTKVSDVQFIAQEFEPDPSCGTCFPDPCPGCTMPPEHLFQGYCLSTQLTSSGAFNSTGCGWAITIFGYLGEEIWTGIKSKGEGPEGKYFRISGGSPTPECVEVEAY